MHKNLLLTVFLIPLFVFGQIQSDTLVSKDKNQLKIKNLILPGSLILVGSVLSGSHFEKEIKRSFNDGSENAIDFSLPIDDLIQYAPIVELYTADLLGVKSKNHWFDQTKYLLIANIVTAALTHAGKNIINKKRPNGSLHAFPSGHTSFSFTNASVLYEEFKDSSPTFAFSGYAITSVVGALRVVNNKHWVSDVLVGAGLGILVTKLVYHFEPLKNWNPFKKKDNMMLIPTVNNNHVGFYFRLDL